MIKYIDFALTAFHRKALTEKYPDPDKTPEMDEAYVKGILGRIKAIESHELDYAEALAFIEKRSEVFAQRTPYEYLLDRILLDGGNQDGLYFPEIREYTRSILPDLTEEEYQSAFDFWKKYQYHLKARQHIKSLVDLIGITGVNIRDGDYTNWGCVGFKGAPNNPPAVEEIISVIDKHTEFLGFSPWTPPMVEYRLEKFSNPFCVSIGDEKMDFFLSSHIGTIYPYGKPNIKTEASNHLKVVE